MAGRPVIRRNYWLLVALLTFYAFALYVAAS